MSTPFQTAMHEFVQASHGFAGKRWLPDVSAEVRAEQRLAQAGDALESEVRRIAREEAGVNEELRPAYPLARYRPEL